jgi:hypothetical protein
MRESMTFTVGRLLCGGLILAGAASSVQGQSAEHSLLDDKVVASVGGFIVTTDVRARLDGSSATNPEIDLNKTFGNDSDATRVRADVLWRITPNQHLRFMYFNDSSSRSRAIDQDIKWGDYTFQAGANVESQRRLQIAEVAYEYAFMRLPTFELAGSLGVHYMDLSLKLSGVATLTDANGNTVSTQFTTKENSVPIPLPVIGVRAGWAFAPKWYLEGQGQIFKANISGYDGRVTDVRAGVTYMFTPNFGAGLGYNTFVVNVDTSKNSFNGNVRLGYSGIQLYVTGAF